jgi:CheY-specific phosphatase CheX
MPRRGCPKNSRKIHQGGLMAAPGVLGQIKMVKSSDQKKKAKQPVLVVKCGENVVCFDSMLVDLLSKIGNFYT